MRYLCAVFLFVSLVSGLSGCGGGGGGGGASTPASASAPATATASTPDVVGNNGGGTATAGVVNLSWDPPGSGDTPVAGYKVSYGPTSGAYNKTIDVGNTTNCSVKDLTPGTYYFAVTAYDAAGTQSDYSNEASKIIM